MSNDFHKNLVLDENHAITARTYADIAARDADTAFFSDPLNLDKEVRVDSPLEYFILADTAPIWVSSASDVSTFLTLPDVDESTYVGHEGEVAQVNSVPDGIEFGQKLRITDDPTFNDLTLEGTLEVGNPFILLNKDGTSDASAIGGGIRLQGFLTKFFTYQTTNDSWASTIAIEAPAFSGSSTFIINTGPPVTGLGYDAGAAVIYLEHSGSEVLKIDAAGKGAFGVHNPTGAKLQITADSNDNALDLVPIVSTGLAGKLRFFEDAPSGANSISLKAPPALSLDVDLTLPDALPVVSNSPLVSDTSGNLSFGVPAGGGDFVGPASSTDNALVRFDGITGKLGQDSSVIALDNGSVGIGETAPEITLHVKNSFAGDGFFMQAIFESVDSAAGIKLRKNVGGLGEWEVLLAGDNRFGLIERTPSQVEHFTILPVTGNVGLGITSPNNALHILRNGNNLKLEGTFTQLRFRESGAPLDEKTFQMLTTNSVFFFSSQNDAESMGMDMLIFERDGFVPTKTHFPNADVGIGTDVANPPETLLEIRANVFAPVAGILDLLTFSSSVGLDNQGLGIQWKPLSTWVMARIAARESSGFGGNLCFETNFGNDLFTNEVMRITDDQRVGIKTSNPLSTLDLNGTLSLKRISISANFNTTTSDQVIIGVFDTTAPRTITLDPAIDIQGRIFIIKDESGAASVANPITIVPGTGVIDGVVSISITVPYGSVSIYCDGIDFFTW